MKLMLLFSMCLYAMGTSHAGWFGPNNYDDCILENTKGVTQIHTLNAIENSCRSKFPQACYAWKKKVNSQYKIGGVYRGYRFKGGDSTDVKNWDKPAGILDDWDAKYGNDWRAKMDAVRDGRGEDKEAPCACVFDALDIKYGSNRVDHSLVPTYSYRDNQRAPDGCYVVLSK